MEYPGKFHSRASGHRGSLEDYPLEKLVTIKQKETLLEKRARGGKKRNTGQFDDGKFSATTSTTGIGLSSEFRTLITRPWDEIALKKDDGREIEDEECRLIGLLLSFSLEIPRYIRDFSRNLSFSLRIIIRHAKAESGLL